MFYLIEKFIKNGKSLYLFSDYHLPATQIKNKINFTQRKDIIKLARKMNAVAIIEDEIAIIEQIPLFSSPEFIRPTHKLTLGQLFKNNQLSENSPLLMLSHWFEQANLPYINIEFRYGPWRPLNSTFALIDNLKKKIRSYDSNDPLKNYYNTQLLYLENEIEIPCKLLFEDFKQCGLTINQYAYQSASPIYYPELDVPLQKLLNEAPWDISKFTEKDKIYTIFTRYCAHLLDFELLHAIAQSKEKNIFVCAGGLHVENIKEGLKILGFEQESAIGETLGFNAETNMYIEPEALPIATSIKKLNPTYAYSHRHTIQTLVVSFFLWLLSRVENKNSGQ